jgi:hypothetical protein
MWNDGSHILPQKTRSIVFVAPDFEGCEIVAGGAEAFRCRPLSWQAVQRDDEPVAKLSMRVKGWMPSTVWTKVGILDGLFHFLKQVGIFSLIEEIEGRDIWSG